MNSEIILCKGIKMDKNYINVLSYGTEKMLELCRQKAINVQYDYSFIRQNKNRIYTNFSYSECLQANYIAFRNPDYSGKWFFAFIDDIVYTGDNNTEIIYSIDSWSTWFSDWQKNKCFIVRQHVNSDKIGENTENENLDIGEVIQETEIEDLSLSSYNWVAVMSAWDTEEKKQYNGITVYNGQVYGKKIYLFEAHDIDQLVNLGLFIIDTNGDGHIADISDIFVVPDALLNPRDLELHNVKIGGFTYTYYTTKYTLEAEKFNTSIPKIHNYRDYTPKNNKCFVYPYNYLLVSNNIGSKNIFKYELFNTDTANFETQLVMGIGCSGRIVPLAYKGMQQNDDEALPLAKYPTCGWTADSYINWLTQQAVNIPVSIASTGINALQNSNVAQGTLTVASEIGNLIGSFYSASLLPPIEGGGNTGDVNFASKRNTFTFRCMRVKTEYLKIIDDYFTRFGYKINKLETPNIIGRKNWNYLEIGPRENIGYGTVPSNFMEEINNACRQGVTIWHKHENLGNYNLDNSII